MKVWIDVLGCPKNEADSAALIAILGQRGHEIVDSPREADVLVVNTCGFIESAKQESIEAILNSTTYGKRVVVHGCLVQRYYKELREEIPEVKAFLGVVTPKQVAMAIEAPDDFVSVPMPVYEFQGREDGDSPYAYLKIGDGCSRNCAFCAIPSIKGRLVNRSPDDVLEEASYLLKRGKKELILVSQDLTQYGFKGVSLINLLEKLDALEGEFWIRLLYLYPDGVSDDLIEFVANSRHVVRYFDVPIQHASRRILSLMNRNEDVEMLKDLFRKIKHLVPDSILRSTVMVGFPGETDDDFQALKDFVKEVKFDRLGAFMYSDEEGTAAYEFSQKVSRQTSRRRFNTIMELQQKISLEKNEELVGKKLEVLVEGKRGGIYHGRTYRDAPEIDGYVHFTSERNLKIGDFAEVEITSYEFYDLEGRT